MLHNTMKILTAVENVVVSCALFSRPNSYEKYRMMASHIPTLRKVKSMTIPPTTL